MRPQAVPAQLGAVLRQGQEIIWIDDSIEQKKSPAITRMLVDWRLNYQRNTRLLQYA